MRHNNRFFVFIAGAALTATLSSCSILGSTSESTCLEDCGDELTAQSRAPALSMTEVRARPANPQVAPTAAGPDARGVASPVAPETTDHVAEVVAGLAHHVDGPESHTEHFNELLADTGDGSGLDGLDGHEGHDHTFRVWTNLTEEYSTDSLVATAESLLLAELTGEGVSSWPHLAAANAACCRNLGEVKVQSATILFGEDSTVEPIRVLMAWTAAGPTKLRCADPSADVPDPANIGIAESASALEADDPVPDPAAAATAITGTEPGAADSVADPAAATVVCDEVALEAPLAEITETRWLWSPDRWIPEWDFGTVGVAESEIEQ